MKPDYTIRIWGDGSVTMAIHRDGVTVRVGRKGWLTMKKFIDQSWRRRRREILARRSRRPAR